MIRKKEMIKELTYTAISMLDDYQEDIISGRYTIKEAQERASKKIRSMRYGRDKKDYFWITDMHPVMIMHPYRLDLEGEHLKNYKDPEGVKLFVDAAEIVKSQGEGYIHYIWQWKDDPNLLVPKISFVKGFDDWGWIIGTGVYLNDIEEEINKLRKRELNIVLFIALMTLIFLSSIIIYSVKLEHKRRKIQETLIESEEKFRNIFHNSNDSIIISDFDGRITDTNKMALEKMGCGKEYLLSKYTFDIIPEKYHTILRERLKSFRNNKKPLTPLEVEIIKKNRDTIPAEINSNVIQIAGKEVILSVIRDLSERKQMEIQVMNAMIIGEEKERSRVAKELHDGLGPILSTIKLYFQWLSESIDKDKRELIIKKGNENIEEALSTLKEVSNNLNPHVLNNYGLMEAIELFTQKLKHSRSPVIHFTPVEKKRFTQRIEISLYRIVIELINNTLKYAKASEINIAFEELPGSILILKYADNGIGVNLERIKKKPKGTGLLNIQNRIKTLAGEVEFVSSPGQGFKAYFSLKV